MKTKVLILCTGNSCRSIIAEALINHYMGDRWEAYSAGVDPSIPNPRAITVLQEEGIDTSSFRSKSVMEFLERNDLDLVITVCDNAKESCPVFPRKIPQVHIGINDPAPYSKDPDEVALPIFRKTIKDVKDKILGVLDSLLDR